MAKRWYPVIDYITCVECGTCAAKCPHGVYDTEKAPSPVVTNPTGCVDHCHSCGNRCPVGAITYVGDDTGWTPPNKDEAAAENTNDSACACTCGTAIDKKEKALSYFSNNFNCSQAVFTTFAVEMGIDEDLALKLATEFGGGARCGQMCGAVSGALMVLGLKYGHCHSDDNEEKAKAYSFAVEFNERFKSKNNSIVCKELLGYDLSSPEDSAIIKQNDLFHTICPKMISDAVEILMDMISEEEPKCSCNGAC